MKVIILSTLLFLGAYDCDAKSSLIAAPRDRRDTGALDPHGEFCVDVSTWGEVEFNRTNLPKCETTFTKECNEIKDEEVKTANIFIHQSELY